MAKRIKITATPGQTYNLDEILRYASDDPNKPIVLQKWYWCPEAADEYEIYSQPNPPDLSVGQIWISIKCKDMEELKSKIGG